MRRYSFIFCLLLANLILLAHAFVPHHELKDVISNPFAIIQIHHTEEESIFAKAFEYLDHPGSFLVYLSTKSTTKNMVCYNCCFALVAPVSHRIEHFLIMYTVDISQHIQYFIEQYSCHDLTLRGPPRTV